MVSKANGNNGCCLLLSIALLVSYSSNVHASLAASYKQGNSIRMAFFKPSIPHCDSTVTSYVRNLTESSYAGQSDEIVVAFTSTAMFILASTFFGLNLFSHSHHISATIEPTIRTFLSFALVLFDPVMSYLFSEAKNASTSPSRTRRGDTDELSLRARTILTWMLLVQLLRRKAEERPKNLGTILRQAAPVIWLGYLVFVSLKSAGQKAVCGTLWLLGAAKFVQRIITNELEKHSLASGKNARLVSSYMETVLEKDGQVGATEPVGLLKRSELVVMGEENMVIEEGPRGYRIDLDLDALGNIKNQNIVTVGKVWEVFSNEQNPKTDPRQLSLSYGLYKLLRRKFEHLPPMSKSETDMCRQLIFEGLCKTVKEPEEALFQVMSDEVNFLVEYYHSVFPVVHASPNFFLVNYIMVPIIILCLCIMVIVLCGNGNVLFILQRIKSEYNAVSINLNNLTECLQSSFTKSPSIFFSTMDLTITFLLIIIFLYEQLLELTIFLLSNWFTVSVVSSYTTRHHQQQSRRQRCSIDWAVRTLMWLRKQLSTTGLVKLKQFSVLSFCRLSLFIGTKPMPREAKRRIMGLFTKYCQCNQNPIDKGLHTLESINQEFSNLSWACQSDSIAEVILIWHIATGLLEIGCPHQNSHPNVATRLSRYCAYLVACHPKLLPDDHQGTTHIYKKMKREMREKLGYCSYYFATERARYLKLLRIASSLGPDPATKDMKIVEKGAVLGKALINKVADGNEETASQVWNMLSDLWTELIVYISPSSGDEHDMEHESALATGGGLVTLLWALTTHTGITRPPRIQITVQHEMASSSPLHECA